MPDTRSHRGAHPEDAALFAPDQQPTLRQACADLAWLLDHGYAMPSSLTLVGDRHRLTQRQRLGVARSICSAEQRERRARHQLEATALRGAELWIDGYNVLISLEAALAGGVILHGRDGCYRDLAGLHGTYRTVAETTPALCIIGESLATRGVERCRWLLDQPVSNSGRLREHLLALALERGWPWEVYLEFSPDALLSRTDAVVATADSVVLDHCGRWTNFARDMIVSRIPSAVVLDLHNAAP